MRKDSSILRQYQGLATQNDLDTAQHMLQHRSSQRTRVTCVWEVVGLGNREVWEFSRGCLHEGAETKVFANSTALMLGKKLTFLNSVLPPFLIFLIKAERSNTCRVHDGEALDQRKYEVMDSIGNGHESSS
jgi:hypothetical protein